MVNPPAPTRSTRHEIITFFSLLSLWGWKIIWLTWPHTEYTGCCCWCCCVYIYCTWLKSKHTHTHTTQTKCQQQQQHQRHKMKRKKNLCWFYTLLLLVYSKLKHHTYKLHANFFFIFSSITFIFFLLLRFGWAFPYSCFKWTQLNAFYENNMQFYKTDRLGTKLV